MSPIPLLSIVEETCKHINGLTLKRVGLLGTKFTMQSKFFKKIGSKYNIEIIVPGKKEQDYIHDKLISEIEFGIFLDETRDGLLHIIKRMIDEDLIKGIILGCTELPLILTKNEFGIPFINSTRVHVESIIQYYLKHARF